MIDVVFMVVVVRLMMIGMIVATKLEDLEIIEESRQIK